MEPARTRPAPPAAFAWLVHAITASGAVLGFLALMAAIGGDWRLSLFWLIVALVVDGLDGSLARWARVKEQAPRIDGNVLDLVVDYLNYVFIPAVLIWREGLVPEPLLIPLVAAIQLSSLYLFARSDMKSEDNYFRGFPSLWNVVAFYLLLTRPGPEVGAAIVCLFTLATFAPVHFVHPFRVRDYGVVLPILAAIWAAATTALLWPNWGEAVEGALLILSLATAGILLGMGLLRTLRGPRKVAT
jgi:phosphatidylcholine synthase